MTMEIATATPCERPPNTGSSRCASEGSPRKPMPIEAMVIPTWQADRYSSSCANSVSAGSAPLMPSFAITSIRDRRARTSANSAATNRPFSSTRRRSRASRRALIARPAASVLTYAASYSEVGRRRSSGPAEPRLARGFSAACALAWALGDQSRSSGALHVEQLMRAINAWLVSAAMSGETVQSQRGGGPETGMDQSEAPYLDALVAYAERDPGRFHVPGHKGGEGADPELVAALGQLAFTHDIPAGIEGVDVGPDSPFQRSQRLAAEAWGAQRSWFLISGASQGNHAACLALRHAGRGVVAQRNIHSSTVDGIVVAGLEPAFVAPELDPELGIAHCLTPDTLADALDRAPDAVAALTVSPTYFGAVADVRGLARVAHAHGVPLIVDEAWGAHLRFSDQLPESALEGGADLVLSSVHKLFGSLTQSAILHLGRDEFIDADVIDRCVTLTESTSPSALLTASLDAARRQAAVRGAELLAETIAGVERARDAIRRIPGLDVLDERLIGRPGVHDWDPLRLAVDVRDTGSTGIRIAKLMRELDDVNLELESENVIVAVFGAGEDAGASAQRLVAGLRHAIETLGAEEELPKRRFTPPPPWGALEMSPRSAFFGPQEVIPFGEAVGRIAAESLAAYPPGIPNVLPGERLTRETADYVNEVVEHGGWVRGAVDRSLKTIRVVVE